MRARHLAFALAVLLGACGSRASSPPAPDAALSLDAADAAALETDAAAYSDAQRARADAKRPATDVGQDAGQAGASWTVLVYMMADNDLESYALADLAEMMTVGSSDTFQLLVQVDRAKGKTAAAIGGLANFTDCKRLRVEAGKLVEEADLGELDRTRPDVLADAIAWAFAAHPADRRALILWDHGYGYAGFGDDLSPASAESFTLPQLAGAITSGLAKAKLDKLDLIGFDACLMGAWEVASTIAPLAHWMLASPELEPDHGWDYGAWKLARDTPGVDVPSLGKAVAAGYAAQAKAQQTDGDITLALVNLDALGPVDVAIAALAEALSEPANAAPAGKALASALQYASSGDPTEDQNVVDLGDFATRLQGGSASLDAARQAVLSAVEAAVPVIVHGPLTYATTGLSVYVPPSADVYDTDYDGLPAAAGWRDFIDAYFAAIDAIPKSAWPAFQEPDNEAVLTPKGKGALVTGTLVKACLPNVTTIALSFGTLNDDGSGTYWGDTPGTLDVQTGLASGTWDGTALGISDGGTQVPIYVTTTPAGPWIAQSSPFEFAPADGSEPLYVERLALIDAMTLALVQAGFYVSGDLGVSLLDPSVPGKLTPQLLTWNDEGYAWATASQGLAWGPKVVVAPMPLSGKEIYLSIDATDFGGNWDYVEGLLTVP